MPAFLFLTPVFFFFFPVCYFIKFYIGTLLKDSVCLPSSANLHKWHVHLAKEILYLVCVGQGVYR